MDTLELRVEPFEVPTDREAVARDIQAWKVVSAADAVRQGLALFNIAQPGELHAPLQAFLFDRTTNCARGGLLGRTGRGGFHIEHLWVAEALRRRGCGAELLARCEAEARARGCCFGYVETYTFQAPAFYQRNGYTIFGRLPGFTGSQELLYLRKELVAERSKSAG